MLTIDNLIITRSQHALSQPISMTLLRGAVLLLKGKNGSGKTSLLRHLAGLSKPMEGSIYWNQVNIFDEYETYCSLMKYLGHQQYLKPHLSVRDNLRFISSLSNSQEMLDAACHYYGLEQVMDTPCRLLSAGWRQRVLLTSMMASPAKLWLLDEPTTHLDEQAVYLLCNAMTIRAQQGGIVIASSHADIPVQGSIEINLADYS